MHEVTGAIRNINERKTKKGCPVRAIHLTYHEVLDDPRVLKECESLAARGIDVTVVCALMNNAPERERFGKLDIRRFNWKDTTAITSADIQKYSSMCCVFPFIESRFEGILRANDANAKIRESFSGTFGTENFEFDVLEYKRYTGLKRVFKKMQAKNTLRRLESKWKKSEPFREIHKKFDIKYDHLFRFTFYKDKQKCFALDQIEIPRKKFVRSLYQLSSVLFDANLSRHKIEGPVDIVHAHDIYTLLAGVRLAERHGAKLIYDAHEYELARASKMPAGGNEMVEALERDCLEHVDALISVSSGICQLYAERFSKRPPVLVLNAPDVGLKDLLKRPTEEERREFRKSLAVESDIPLIFFTGNIGGAQRGLDKVVQALTHLPRYHLVVLGRRHPRMDPWLMKEAEEAGVQDRVHLLDPVSHRDVVPTISLGDVSILPIQDASLSYRHAMPNKLFEAVFSGLPVCVADLPDMREFIETHGRGMAMDQTDAKTIAETVSKLYENKHSYIMSDEKLGALVRDFGWDAQADKLEALYNDLCATNPQTS